MSIFQTTLSGYVARDPESRQVGQSQVVSFSVPHTERWTDKQTGEQKEKTTWVNCKAWNERGQLIMDNVRKGYGVTVIGTIETRAYLGQDGEAKASLDLTIDKIQWISTAPKDDSGEVDLENIPF